MASITSGVPIHSPSSLLSRFQQVRSTTLRIADPLSAEDTMLQSMPDASPVKWHLAHSTWFFETFILSAHAPDYHIFHPEYRVLFNSYYKTIGAHPVRAQRGTFSRPSLANVLRYREHVDEAVQKLLNDEPAPEVLSLVELGLHHEQQHQELMFTDLLHGFWTQPLQPAYAPPAESSSTAAEPLRWIEHSGGVVEIGAPENGFAFDNERPRHRTLLEPYSLASRLVTNAEYLDFINDKGYLRSELWLSEGWDTICREAWRAPLYWENEHGEWMSFGLRGFNRLNPAAPVTHLSYFEADAFARWAGARLPLEGEWEQAASEQSSEQNIADNLLESWALRALPSAERSGVETQMFGDLWEWTGSAYLGYPGFRAAAGAVGEYNGKFMCNQFVLRGGSFATSASHIRASYRNFFPPHARWQFTGLRLAKHER